MAGWRESLRGPPPELWPVGPGFELVEIGPGRLVLAGGRPGAGKSAMVCQWTIDALRAAPTLRAVVANVEMSAAVLLDRQLARLSGVRLDVIVKRQLTAEHADRIDRGLATLESVADRLAFVAPPFDLGNIAATADDFGARLLVLDYVQRIGVPGQHRSRREEIDTMMARLRAFCDAGFAVLLVSAMARVPATGKHGAGLASFRESSELEYGADAAFALVPAPDAPNIVELRCLKNRHGEPRDLTLQFDRPRQSFSVIDGGEPPEPEPDGGLRDKLLRLWNAAPAAGNDGGGNAA